MKKEEFLEKFKAACDFYDAKKYREAFDLFQSLAELGEPVSQYRLSIFYALGLHVRQSDQLAFEWVNKAAAGDYPAALVTAGEMLLAGRGVEKNFLQGLAKIIQAAEAGGSKAQALACLLYGRHAGNPVSAYRWGLISKTNPATDPDYNKLVEKEVVDLEKKLSPEQIKATKDIVANWRPVLWEPPEDLFES